MDRVLMATRRCAYSKFQKPRRWGDANPALLDLHFRNDSFDKWNDDSAAPCFGRELNLQQIVAGVEEIDH